MSGKVKGKRRGRPPGSKNKVKEEAPAPIARANGVRKINRPRSPRASFLQPNAKHLRLIQYWSKETKIGMQQIFDDFMNAGAVAAPKIYKGLINSRKAIEDLFDAETNTERVANGQTTTKPNRLSDSENDQPDVQSELDSRRGIQESPSLAPVGPGYFEETGADLGEPVGIIDAPPTTAPEEEQVEEDDQDDEPPY